MEGKILALACAVCFGLNPVMLRIGFTRAGSVDAAVIIGLAVAIPLYVALLPFAGGLQWSQVSAPALVAFALAGLFGAGIGRRWLYLAIERIGAAPATALKNTAPLFTTGLAIPILGERVSLIQWAAVLSIIAGITLVSWRGGGGAKQLLDLGVIAALGSALSYGIRPLILKFGLNEANLPMTAVLIGAISALAYAVLMSRPWRERQAPDGPGAMRNRLAIAVDRPVAFWLFVGAGVAQSLGFLALTLGLATDAVSLVYPVTSTAPIFTLAFAWLFLRGTEAVTWRLAVGVFAVTAGVLVL
ncbi:MAG TPA: DMT family transporter [Candidatus Limnocylindria bacterium]|jgi:drug/metabolite transporter (DMT)-like permease|nr:DMT family transporter [Candidatus Limnocylindria bacterium]